jgi:hypothetical protein
MARVGSGEEKISGYSYGLWFTGEEKLFSNQNF